MCTNYRFRYTCAMCRTNRADTRRRLEFCDVKRWIDWRQSRVSELNRAIAETGELDDVTDLLTERLALLTQQPPAPLATCGRQYRNTQGPQRHKIYTKSTWEGWICQNCCNLSNPPRQYETPDQFLARTQGQH